MTTSLRGILQIWKRHGQPLMKFLASPTIKKNFHLISLWKIKKFLINKILQTSSILFSQTLALICQKTPKHQDKSMESYLKENILCSFNFELIEQDTVKKIIKRLNAKHSSGHDNVSTILLKEIIPLISSPLTLILNQSLTTGIFPDKLKIAKIIPLFKKMIHIISIITDQSHFFLPFPKYLKRQYSYNYMII